MDAKKFNCSEAGCSGTVIVDPKKAIVLQTGCQNFSPAWACSGCGRLYFDEGCAVVGRGENPDKAFLIDGKVTKIPQKAEGLFVTAMHP